VRILFGDISTEWKRTLSGLAFEEGIEVIGEAVEPLNLLLQVNQHAADVVVLSQLENGGEPGICSHLLLEYSNLGILLLPSTPDSGPLHWMVLHREVVKEASTEGLRYVLRKARSRSGRNQY
jgi:AmiR/NasT family two-component response regulator